MVTLYQNPDGSIGADGSGSPMVAPTQAEFEDCCCGCPCLEIYNGVPSYRITFTYRHAGYIDPAQTFIVDIPKDSFGGDCYWSGSKVISYPYALHVILSWDTTNCRWSVRVTDNLEPPPYTGIVYRNNSDPDGAYGPDIYTTDADLTDVSVVETP